MGFLLMISFLGCMVMLVGFIFCFKAIVPKTYSHEAAIERETEKGRLREDNFYALKKEEIQIESPNGYTLYGYWLSNEPSKKTIIFCHGITYTLHGSVKYMEMFLKRGFNVLIYDHRNHGKSGGKYTTFGYYEKEDLRACTDYVFQRVGKDSIVGTHGESMGAATALENIGIDHRISFCISDCSYDSAMGIFKYRLKEEYKLAGVLILPIASLFSKWLTGASFFDVSPIEAVGNSKLPILFIHGLADTYTPYQMTEALYEAKTEGVKQLYLVPDARHAGAYWTDPEGYDKAVGQFLAEIGLE